MINVKKKKIASIALAASIVFNFSNAEMIVKADEKFQDYAQENLVEETNDVEKEDNILEECATPVLNNENYMQENLSDEINNCELESINLDNTTSYDEDKQIEINEEQVKLQDEISIEEDQDEETCYEELQSVNASNTNVTWGEDENYSWSNNECTIYDVKFGINDDNTTVTIIDCENEKSGNLTLPNKIKVSGIYYNVTSIGDRAFYYCRSLSSITIPNNVTSISDSAFRYCISLQDIYVDTNNKYYCDEDGILFNKDKTKLIRYPGGKKESNYIIPNSVTSIGNYAFASCKSLSSVTIPNNVTSIGNFAFDCCSSLSSITLPNSVESIGNSAFSYCSSLSSITILNGVTNIGDGVFYDCTSLINVTLPNSVTSIGNYAFMDCSSLSSITISNTVESIGVHTFVYCSSLSSITIPNSVTSIDDTSFHFCGNFNSVWTSQLQYNKFIDRFHTRLKPVLIESNLYSRENYKDDVIKIKGDYVKCFERCSDGSKKEIVLEKDSEGYFIHDPSKSEVGTKYYSYEAVKDGVTYESPVISVNVTEADNSYIWDGNKCIIDGIEFELDSDKNTVSISGCNNKDIDKVILPKGINVGGFYYDVTSIKENAFNSCNNLSSIDIPDSITSIGDSAFCRCGNLKDVRIPYSVTSIGENVFGYCGNISNIYVDENNENYCSIDGVLFSKDMTKLIKYPEGRKETEYNIGSNVTSIDKDAFLFCSSVKNITVDKDNKNYCDIDGVLFSKDKTQLIKYPQGRKEKNYIIPEGTTSIGYSAFNNCYSLNNIIIPESMISIENSVFKSCHYLTGVAIPNRLINIGEDAFYNCSRLYSIIIPNSVETIGKNTFAYTSLKPVWTSEAKFKEFKNNFKWNSILIDSNLYNRKNYTDDVIKIKADYVKCFERCSDGSKKEIALEKDSEGYFIHDPSRDGVGTKYYTYEAVINGVTYESPEISVEVSKDTVLSQWNNDLFTENNITYLKTSK